MSLLEAPFSFLSVLDQGLARGAPDFLRLMLWATLAAVLSMELYRLLSPQARVRALKIELNDAQREAQAFDGDFADGWPLITGMLRLALRRVWLVLPGTVLACLPLLVLVLWLSDAYAGRTLLPFAPAWLGGWEAVFLPSLLVAALLYKWARRIE